MKLYNVSAEGVDTFQETTQNKARNWFLLKWSVKRVSYMVPTGFGKVWNLI